MMTETMGALLRKQPFVEGLDEDEVVKLAELAEVVPCKSGAIILNEGQVSTHFFLIVTGSVALELVPPTGVVRMDTLGAGDEFGWSSVMGRASVFQSRALTDVELIGFDAVKLRALCESDTDFGFKLMRRLLDVVTDRLHVTRVHLMDSYWPVAKRAGA